ncbi:MAG: hypothetical protein AB1497_00080 [Bacillota bacterium]
MRKAAGFWRGLVTGGLIATAMAVWFQGRNMRQPATVRIIRRGREMGKRASKMMKRARERMENMLERGLRH